jgi:hypothetical protein
MARASASAIGAIVARVNLSLRTFWRVRGLSGMDAGLKAQPMSPETLESFLSLALGFAVAGLISAAYQAITTRPASFRLLHAEARPAALAAVPFLVFAAPFIIMRNTIRGRRIEGRRFEFVMLATVLAGIWSMMSGTAVVMVLRGLGL